MDEDLNRAAAHCPRCGGEYRAGFDLCADDGTPLIPGPPVPPPVEPPPPVTQPPSPPGNWRAVATFWEEDEARLLVGRLEAEGIDARLFPEEAGTYYGKSTSPFLGRPWEVLVPEDSVGDAALVIQAIGDE